MTPQTNEKWKIVTLISLIGLIAIIFTSAITGLWVLTAIPIGFLFGFFLEKADLCGSSAFSEVLLVKDWHKLAGLWMIIVVGMILFAGMSLNGLIELNPRPLLWASHIVGGIAFGVGIVLAGGCVSGCLFKTGQGNINSMVGLIGIPFGVAAVEYGPLHKFSQYLNNFVIKTPDNGPVTLSSLTGVPFWFLAIFFAIATLVGVWALKRRNHSSKSKINSSKYIIKQDNIPFLQKIVTKPWKPWQAGIAIGVLGAFAYLSSAASGRNYPLGVTHGVLQTALLATDAPLKYVYAPPPVQPAATEQKPAPDSGSSPPAKKVSWWLILEVNFLVLGAFVSAKLSNKIKFIPRPPDQTIVAFFGGMLLGAGAGISGACIVGNVMSGFALMSVGSILFGLMVLLANWATTFFYHMGGEMY
jgi:uncharacterized protein